GPPIDAACPLLSTAEVGQALGFTAVTASEDQGAPAAVLKSCFYNAAEGTLKLMIGFWPAGNTALGVVNTAVTQYSGTLDAVPDLGDAALVTVDEHDADVIFALDEGAMVRQVTLLCYGRQRAVEKERGSPSRMSWPGGCEHGGPSQSTVEDSRDP